MSVLDGNSQEVQCLSVFVKLMRASESISSSVHRQLVGHSLTISQFGVLEALFHLGPLCQKEIAAKILKSSGNITMVIDNLEKRELAIRKRDRNDRRFYEIHLTTKGRALIKELFPAHAARITRRLSTLSPEELRTLGGLLKKIGLHDNREPDGNKETA